MSCSALLGLGVVGGEVAWGPSEAVVERDGGGEREELDVCALGCLGDGMLLRREALRAYCATPSLPRTYVELQVPTVLYHLGFEIADVDALSDVYSTVRWRTEYTVQEAIALKRAGRTFVHPFRKVEEAEAILESSPSGEEPRPAQN